MSDPNAALFVHTCVWHTCVYGPPYMFTRGLCVLCVAHTCVMCIADACEQELSVWEWTAEGDSALYTTPVPDVVGASSAHTSVAFNPSDPREVVTTGLKAVIFWTWESFILSPFAPVISKKDGASLNNLSFLKTIYLPESSMCVTSSTTGDLVLWDAVPVDYESAANENAMNSTTGGNADMPVETFPRKNVVKTIRLCSGRIDWLSTVDTRYLVVAGSDGAVRFYDFSIRIMAWYEDLNAGPVTSVSFASSAADWQQQPVDEGEFVCPDFMVGTSTSYVIGVECGLFSEIEPENRRGAVLVQGLGDEVPCIACHPTMDRLLIGVYDGTLQLWDYRSRTLLMVQELRQETQGNMGGQGTSVVVRPQTIEFDPSGNALAIGMTSGMIRICDPESLQEVESFAHSDAPITFAKFSGDSNWLAAADAQNYVYIYNFVMGDQQQQQPEDDNESSTSNERMVPKWVYVGRYQSHSKAITGLEFTIREDGRTALVSIGEDRMLVEYDLSNATPETGVTLRSAPTKIEQTAIPTACMWHPLLGGDFEDRIITANNEFKFKQWNADNKSCRRTNLCPTYGGPLNSLIPIPAIDSETNKYGPSNYIVYSTAEKVVGIIKLPLDGNPNKAMGLIGHPSGVSSIAVSADGRVVFTAGGKDRCVNIWNVNVGALEAKEAEAVAEAAALAEGSASMFGELIEPEIKQDIVDYFYYAQLRTQGEDATEEREITGTVPLQEIPNMVRALGYYPSEEEVANMVAEIKYATFTETGEAQEVIDLDTFIKLYINHKPVFGTSKTEIEEAFGVLGDMDWGKMVKLLKERGEVIEEADLKNMLTALMGTSEGEEVLGNLSERLSADDFADKVLGFSEVEEDDFGLTGAEDGAE